MKYKNVVTIGGGTGSFVLLTGLKKYPINISAIVSMVDDGGSTGRLRDELGVLPPGDIRQCLVALSESSETLRELMNYRFESGSLKGHSFGNIFLSALEKIKGKFSSGVGEISKILNVKGTVIPVTNDSVHLHIQLKNGKILKGQKNLDDNPEIRKIGIKKVFLSRRAKANPWAIQCLKEANLIVIGPGDFWGSIVPNFLVDGIREAICHSKAKVVFNCNMTNKRGQTEDYDVLKYIEETNKLLGSRRINFATFNVKRPKANLVKKYQRKEGVGSMVNLKENRDDKLCCRVIKSDLLNEKKIPLKINDDIAETRSFIRHDPAKLAKVLIAIMNS